MTNGTQEMPFQVYNILSGDFEQMSETIDQTFN
jgi:hypothetical protein